jgi:N-glycosylase/DNA lyase
VTSTLALEAPRGFVFRTTVESHGWYALRPFAWDARRGRLGMVLDVGGPAGRAFDVEARAGARGRGVVVEVDPTPRPDEARAIAAAVSTVLGLGDDLEELYALTDGDARLGWARAAGAGRLLRGPTVFEDVVKIVCTTNCTWAFTTRMVERMVGALGRAAPSGRRAFPTPAALAAAGERFLRDEVRAGYRAPHIARIAGDVAAGRLDLEALRGLAGDASALARALRALPGVGPYAAAHLLRLLGSGDADHLGLDSWCRERLAAIYPRSRADVDGAAARRYRRFGRWAGHAMWLDVTRHWHLPD